MVDTQFHPHPHNPESTAKIAGHPLHPMLVPFPVAFFAATLACDLVFQSNGDVFWFTATQCLLGAGIAMALVAALAGFTDFLGDRRIRDLKVAWWHFGGNLLVALIEAFNWYQRHDQGPGAVGAGGMWFSLRPVVVMLGTGWLGWEMVYRKHVAVADG
jgi:uncharacterized membrane protein